jgi:ferredoxin
VDCFYLSENMLVIHPDECIDCGVCEPECPAEAIVPNSDDRAGAWLERNTLFAKQWPNNHPQGRGAGRRGRVEGQAPQGGAVLARAGGVTWAEWIESFVCLRVPRRPSPICIE